MERIRSGVYGLDNLIDGGLLPYSNTVVIGPSGAGKTTVCTHFIRRGLENRHDGIFISLDENKEQIINEVKQMGWTEVDNYIEEGRLVFIDASGKKFKKFIDTELADFVATWEGSKTRIIIDPLTPVVWSIENPYKQRNVLSNMFKLFRKVGTVIATLEEHNKFGDLSGPEVVIPMYLADTVIHLNYRPLSKDNYRAIQVIKSRNTRHYEGQRPYRILNAMGVVIDVPEKSDATTKFDVEAFRNKTQAIIKKKQLPSVIRKHILEILNAMGPEDMMKFTPEKFVDIISSSY